MAAFRCWGIPTTAGLNAGTEPSMPPFHLFSFEANPSRGKLVGPRRPQPRLIDCAGVTELDAAIAVARARLRDDPLCARIDIWAQGRRRHVVTRGGLDDHDADVGGGRLLAPFSLQNANPKFGDCND